MIYNLMVTNKRLETTLRGIISILPAVRIDNIDLNQKINHTKLQSENNYWYKGAFVWCYSGIGTNGIAPNSHRG